MAKGNLFARCDLHVHSSLSPCAQDEMTPSAIVQAAAVQGIEYLGITDHIHPDTDVSILDRAREEFTRLEPPMTVFIGCEAEVLEVGRTTVDESVMARSDFIILSANHFTEAYIDQPASRDKDVVARHFLEMLIYAASLDYVDVIAHPLFVMPDTYDPLAPALLTAEELWPVVELAVKNDIAIEISRRALEPDQQPCMLNFYKMCREAGLKFAIGSDSHRLADVGRTYLVEPIIRELGLTDKDIWLPNGVG